MANPFKALLDAQRTQFPSDATKSYEWRIDQLDRMERRQQRHGKIVAKAGYSFRDELPILAVTFIIPTLIAAFAIWGMPRNHAA